MNFQSQGRKRLKGFTLMEMLIVMALVAIASALVIPRIGNNDNKLYQAQLKSLLAVLNYNRRNAVILNRPQRLKLFPYRKNQTDDEAEQTLKQGDWHSKGAALHWQSDKVETENQAVTLLYFPQGGATGGTLTLTQGRYMAKITISGITGKHRVEESSTEEE